MRKHWNISSINYIFINLSSSVSQLSIFCCYHKSECLHVVCFLFILKLHCLETSITNVVQMIFTKTSDTFLTNPYTFSKFLLVSFVIWFSNYWFNTIKTCLTIRSFFCIILVIFFDFWNIFQSNNNTALYPLIFW